MGSAAQLMISLRSFLLSLCFETKCKDDENHLKMELLVMGRFVLGPPSPSV